MQVPAALAALPFVAGGVAGALLGDESSVQLSLASATGALLCAAAALGWIGDRMTPEASLGIALGTALAGLSLGLLGAEATYRTPLLTWFMATLPDEPVVVEGRLREDAALTDYGGSLEVDVTHIGYGGRRLAARGGVRLSVGGAGVPAAVAEWRAGRSVRLPALVRLPTTYRNPGAGDERRSLARRGIVLVGSVKSAALIEVTARGHLATEAAGAARAWARRTLARHVADRSSRSTGVVSAILIGDRTGLADEDERRLQEAGTYHVIAISGGNIAILVVILMAALRGACVPAPASAATAIGALLFYAHLTAWPASVTRAVLAAVVFLGGRILDHRGPPLNALAVTAVVVIAVSPMAVLDPGFILSFGATLGILTGAPPLMAWVSERSGLPRRPRTRSARATRQVLVTTAGLLVATICAEVALAPAGAAMYSRVTSAGLLLNFVAIPLMTVAQIAALGTIVLAPLHDTAASACGGVAGLAAAGLVESARLVDILPWLAREVTAPAWWVVVAYYGGCVGLFLPRLRALSALGLGLAGASIVSAPAATSRDVLPPNPGLLRVAFLDVGQGDATVVTLPDGRSVLVDAAGLPASAFDIGGRVVAPALRALGIRSLEELVITHGDPDHLGGALAIARRFSPRAILEGTPVPPHAGLRALGDYASAHGVIWRNVQAGDSERVAGVERRVLHPPVPDWERQRVRNDDSIVLELRFGHVSIVLPGDIGREPESLIAPGLALAPLVVLKAPHHGSATSSTPEFIRATMPDVVVFSAGANNRFGHPAPAVAARFEQAGAAIFRTDRDGAVIVETDGRSVVIRTRTHPETLTVHAKR